jgi:sulfofructose kinase
MSNEIDIVGVGMAALDLLIRTPELPTWDQGARVSQLAIEGGGPVATAMVAAQRLGAKTAMVTTYGNDRLGQIKLQTLVENGVNTRHMLQRSAPENHTVLVIVNEQSGARIFSGVSSPSFPPLAQTELDYAFITSAKILHIDGCYPEAACQAAAWMHALGKPVMMDGSATCGPISQTIKDLVKLTDILICGSGFGTAFSGKTDLREAAEEIRQFGPQIIVQTEGECGSYTLAGDEFFHTPAFPVDVVDTTGAGDVFHGAYLVGLLHGWSPRGNALFSSAVAAIKCTKLGGRPGIPDFYQAINYLKNRGIELDEYSASKPVGSKNNLSLR